MGMQIFWHVCPPDGRYPWEVDLRWDDGFNHVRNIATAVDSLGFSGVLVAIGSHRVYDGWTLASALIPVTQRLRFLIAVYPGVITPTQLALMARTFDRFSGGRLMFNVVGSNPAAMHANGIHLPKDERYAMLLEYWTLFKRIYAGEPIPEDTRFFKLEKPESQFYHIPPTQFPHPPMWAAGGSPEEVQAATALADTYLAVVDTPLGLKKRVDVARAAAEAQGRGPLHYGIALPCIVRETEDEAWDVAARWLQHTSMNTVRSGSGWAAAMSPDVDISNPAVERSIAALKAGRFPAVRDLEIHPEHVVRTEHRVRA